VRVARSVGRFLLPRSHLIHAIFISIFLYFYISIFLYFYISIFLFLFRGLLRLVRLKTDAVFVVA
jgi:hypothetical protein